MTTTPVRLSSGRETTRDVVRHPGAVAILPLHVPPDPTGTDEPTVILLRQFRFAIDRTIWEIPAGTLDVPGESPADCARRELIEETGFACDTLREIGTFYTAPGFCDEQIRLYVAWGLTPARADRDADEQIEVRQLAWPEVRALRDAGEIDDAKTLIALGWLDRRLRGAADQQELR